MGKGGPCRLWASPDSNPANAGSSYWCGEHCAGGGAGQDSHMSKTGWLGLPLGVTFNKTSMVYARMQSWQKPEGAILYSILFYSILFYSSSTCFLAPRCRPHAAAPCSPLWPCHACRMLRHTGWCCDCAVTVL